jgi:DNA-binding response OmpR family regulator
MNALLDPPIRTSSAATSNRPGLANILFAEDNEALRRISTLTLTRSGYVVTPVEDGLQAWKALHADRYDLLITDNDMPRLTGVELIKRVRLARMRLPVIVASGTVNTEEVNQHRALDFAATLLKPFTTDHLLEVVEEVLRAAGSAGRRGSVFLPALAETFDEVRSPRHWGLNE